MKDIRNLNKKLTVKYNDDELNKFAASLKL